MSKMGRPIGPRPDLWKAGPDETRHEQFKAWGQQKNQAQFRKEVWDIELEDWIAVWGDKWDQRGRKKGQYCLTRICYFDDWTADNVCIMTREDHSKAIGKHKQVVKLLKQLNEERANDELSH